MKAALRNIFLLLSVTVSGVHAQSPFASSGNGQASHQSPFEEKAALPYRLQSQMETAASLWFDVTYYRLDLNIKTSPDYLKGNVTIAGICRTGSARSITLDLANTMRIDSVIVDGQNCPFAQNAESFDITLARSTASGETLSIDVFYEGVPLATGLGSFSFDSHAGEPWVYSLSEPYGAKDWWPCKNGPGDKADSADIIVTCDSIFKVGSEGTLVSVTGNGDGTSASHWKERYPIASYLISVAVTNYAQFSNWYRYSAADSMEVLNYVLPEHYADALQALPKTTDMLAIYSDLFGVYPFIKEKYGHAEFGSGGAMEHQTMTSTTSFDEKVLSHELAHQWFGDMITCRTWHDLWLNEGFAQYCTGLYLERRYGADSYWAYMNQQLNDARTAQGAIGNPDTSSVYSLFGSALMYAKGASVLHMLRHVLGDSVFFRSIKAYAGSPALRYSTAAIKDFQSVCERVSGKNLNYFFQEWIYGEIYPVYYYTWTWKSQGDSSAAVVDIRQISGRSNPAYFTMPLDIRITAGGRDTVFTVLNNAQQQSFIFKSTDKPSAVVLDPGGWILKFSNYEAYQLPADYVLEQNYPNPFNAGTNIMYRLQHRSDVSLKIYDVLGREIAELVHARQGPGVFECPWTAPACASGIYFYRLTAGNITLQKKMVLLR